MSGRRRGDEGDADTHSDRSKDLLSPFDRNGSECPLLVSLSLPLSENRIVRVGMKGAGEEFEGGRRKVCSLFGPHI